MSQKHKSTDVSSKFEMSSSTGCDVQENVHSILQHSISKKVQNVKKLKKNENSSVVSSEDDDILHPKKCTRPLTTANMSKENITTSDTEFIEKSPSVLNVSHSQSDCEFSQSSNAFSQIKESSTQSAPRSVRQSGNLSQILSEIRDFPKKTYIQTQEISSKLDIVIMNLSILNRFLLPNEKRIVRPTDLPSLSITTNEELNKFETFLSENDNITGTICYMSQIIGSKDNIKEATYKVLKKLISNTLASEFNLKGGGNPSKKCFEKLTLYEVVEGAILSKKPQAELIKIAAATSSWLKQAPWRRQDDGTMGKRTK